MSQDHALKHVYLIPSDSDEEMEGAYYDAFAEPPWMTHLLSDADVAAGPRLGDHEAPVLARMAASPTQPILAEPLPAADAAHPPHGGRAVERGGSPQQKRLRAAPRSNGAYRGYNFFATYNDRAGELADFATNVEKRNAMFPLHEKFQYIEFVLEQGGHTERLHVHAYIRTRDRFTATAIVKLFPNAPGIHFGDQQGQTFGTPESMLEYIRKHDDTYRAGPWAKGEAPRPEQKQGHRSDIDRLAAKLRETGDLQACAREFTTTYIRYAGGIEKTAAQLLPPPPAERPMEVMWIWGPTRQGKTTLVLNYCKERFNCEPYSPPVAKDGQATHTFDEYNMEKVLFLDEFDYKHWNINILKKMLDKFKLQLTCRFHNKFAFWELVIICTNASPATCWCQPGDNYNPEDVRAIFARVGTNVYYKERKEQRLADCARTPQFNPEDGTMIVQI